MWKKNITVQEGKYSLQPQRANTLLIMEDLIDAELKENKLAKLNRCRMYLKFTYIQDVSTGGGHSMPPSDCQATQRKK